VLGRAIATLSRLAAMDACRTLALAISVLVGLIWSGPALAQFHSTPTVDGTYRQPSFARTEREYRKDGARHLYAAYRKQIHKGKLPPLLYGIAIIETDIGAGGKVRSVRITRQPAAAEVGPWAVAMIRKASPFPPPPATMRSVKYTEIWLVHRSGRFQLDSLTEGQL